MAVPDRERFRAVGKRIEYGHFHIGSLFRSLCSDLQRRRSVHREIIIVLGRDSSSTVLALLRGQAEDVFKGNAQLGGDRHAIKPKFVDEQNGIDAVARISRHVFAFFHVKCHFNMMAVAKNDDSARLEAIVHE